MNDKPFFDTNIAIYAFSSDPRTAKADDLLNRGGFISVQVMNEFARVMRRKQQRSWNEIRTLTTALHALAPEPFPVTRETHEKALSIAERFNFEFFDCLIVAAALLGGCTTLYTEDLQHGQVIEGLTIRNPFIS
jgi:predicted nucleic acid-binding protein